MKGQIMKATVEPDIREIVREKYAQVALSETTGSKPASSCCGGSVASQAATISKMVGYSEAEMAAAPDGANLGLGCGNPTAHAELKQGQTVLDLGSGAGFDAFLAAKKVGDTGKVIGVDMTPEMIARARKNASANGYTNVEFRLGEIEHLPVDSDSVDVIISNCVINLSPDKPQTFREAFRVLKPGGRLLVSDLVLRKPLPDFVRESVAAYVGCIAGAMLKEDYISTIRQAGFASVNIVEETSYPVDFLANDPLANELISSLGMPKDVFLKEANETVASIRVSATKAAKRSCCG